jgi:hypothetical protein
MTVEELHKFIIRILRNRMEHDFVLTTLGAAAGPLIPPGLRDARR